MSKKKGRAKEAKVNTPIEELGTKETIMHYNAVLLEEQNSKFQLVIERMDALSEQVDQKIRALSDRVERGFQEVDNRFLEVNNRFERVDGRLSTLELAFRGLKDDMIDMERRICSKINRITDRCEHHDCCLATLEANTT